MNETKKNSSTLGIDRIAIMTALNLANDLLKNDLLRFFNKIVKMSKMWEKNANWPRIDLIFNARR